MIIKIRYNQHHFFYFLLPLGLDPINDAAMLLVTEIIRYYFS